MDSQDQGKVNPGYIPTNGVEMSSTKIQYSKNEKDPKISLENDNIDSISQIIVEKKDWKYFWRRVINDIKNKNLIPVKILFFFKYATLFVLYPFLTLHMDALGLDEWEIGINQATAPIVAILGPPFAGIVADRIGNFKILLSVLTLLNAGVALLLLLVPTARETITLPNYMTFEISCQDTSSSTLPPQFILDSIDDSICSVNTSNAPWNHLPESSVLCGFVCPASGDDLSEDSSTVQNFPRFSTIEAGELFSEPRRYLLPNRVKTFEPLGTDQTPQLICTQDIEGEKCFLGYQYLTSDTNSSKNDSVDSNFTTEPTNIKRLRGVRGFDGILSLTHLALRGESLKNNSASYNVSNLQLTIQGPFTFNGQKHEDPVCSSEKKISSSNCTTKCYVQYDRPQFCSNTQERRVYNVALTFGIYTAFRLLLGFFSATSFIMFEGAVLSIMKQFGGDYGLQRVSATFAAIIAAPLSGTLLKSWGFRPIFFLYGILQVFSAVLTLKIDLKFKNPSEKVITHLKEVLSQVEILIFFVAMFWSGTAWGYLETFLFLFLKSLGGSPRLMGLTISVGGLAGLPILIFSRPIIKRLGHVNVLCIGLLFYCFRYLGYSIIEDPWLCLPFEALEAITASLAITAASTYAVALSSLQTIASIQGIMGCLYFGFGRGAGSFIGGILIREFGHRQTFQIFGIGSLTGSVLYLFINVFYLRKHSIAHKGLDINNLQLHRHSISNQNGTNGVLNGSSDKKDAEKGSDEKTGDKNYISSKSNPIINPYEGGFEGPLDINKFTDVPLDEELQGNNSPLKSRKNQQKL